MVSETSHERNTTFHLFALTLLLFFQALSDRLLGGSLLAVATFVFSYYTVWALITVSTRVSQTYTG